MKLKSVRDIVKSWNDPNGDGYVFVPENSHNQAFHAGWKCPGLKWAEQLAAQGKTARQGWFECTNGEWLSWVVYKIGLADRKYWLDSFYINGRGDRRPKRSAAEVRKKFTWQQVKEAAWPELKKKKKK